MIKMKISKITGKQYSEGDAVYLTNPIQCQRYFKYLGDEYFLDILYTSEKREDALVFVWKKCPETREAKIKWDNHEL
jgi:hypothetical protein